MFLWPWKHDKGMNFFLANLKKKPKHYCFMTSSLFTVQGEWGRKLSVSLSHHLIFKAQYLGCMALWWSYDGWWKIHRTNIKLSLAKFILAEVWYLFWTLSLHNNLLFYSNIYIYFFLQIYMYFFLIQKNWYFLLYLQTVKTASDCQGSLRLSWQLQSFRQMNTFAHCQDHCSHSGSQSVSLS